MKIPVVVSASIVSALLIGPLCAQRAVPVLANFGDANARTQFPFVYDMFRYQMVLSGSSFCTNSATITGVAFRRDTQVNTEEMPKAINHLDVFAAHASTTPATMSTSFSTNYASAQTAVFSGPFNLPSLPPTPPGQFSGPFSIRIPFGAPFAYQLATGDLLIDFVSSGRASTRVEYFVDAAYVGSEGFGADIGTGGQFGSGEQLRLGLDPVTSAPGNLVPGGTIASEIQGLHSTYPTVFFYGLSSTFWGGGPLPADFAPFGAPGNTLFVRPDVFSAVKVPLGFPGSYWTVHALPIPNVPSLSSATAWHQAVSLDPTANSLGLVLSSGLVITIGPANGAVEVNLLGSPDSGASTGGFAMGNPNGRLGGPVTEIQGTFQ